MPYSTIASDQGCATACEIDPENRCGPQLNMTSCRTNCDMLVTAVPVGPGLVQLDLHSSMPLLQELPTIDFSALIAAPLTVSLKNRDDSTVTFTELSDHPR